MSVADFRNEVKLFKEFPYKIQFSNTPQRLFPHWHEQVELMYFYSTDGCEYLCHGEIIEVKAGDLIVANSCEVHECFDFGKNTSVCCLIFDPYALGCKDYIFLNKYSQNNIVQYFEKLKALNHSKKEYNFEVMSNLYGIIAELYKVGEGTEYSAKNFNIKRIKEAFKYINANISEAITVSNLAKTVALSEDGFYHIFKDATGVGPSLYILQQRIQKAQKMLIETDLSITEISENCGFCTPSYFAEKFKRVCGVSPNKYRKEGQNLD